MWSVGAFWWQATCHVYHLRYQYLRQDLTPSVIPRRVRQQRQNVTPSVIPCRVLAPGAWNLRVSASPRKKYISRPNGAVLHSRGQRPCVCWPWNLRWSAIRFGFGSPRKKYILAPTGRYCIAQGNALAYVGRGISVGRLSVLASRIRVSA